MILLILIWGSLNILIKYFVGVWFETTRDEEGNRIYFNIFWTLIVILFIASGLMSFNIYCNLLLSSSKSHKTILWKVLRAPVVFFDANPIGRILTRFSSDIFILDYLLGFTLNNLMDGLTKSLGIMVLIWINNSWMLIPLSVIFVCMYWAQSRCQLTLNESQRIDGITKGEINTKLGSAIDGLSSIRAYQKEKYF